MGAVAKNSMTMFDRINNLLLTDLRKILNCELHNENRVNLYDVGECWVAFEKSAYLLDQMIDDDNQSLVLYVKNHPFPLVMRSAHYHKIKDICRKHIMTKRNLEQLQFATHPIDDNSYAQWYRKLVIDEE